MVVFLINLLALIVCHFKKKYQIRNYLGFFLFIFWPCCFYVYLSCFVNASIDQNILYETYESPYSIKMNLESFSYWFLRFIIVSSIQCPILGFELNSIYFKQFILETYYCLAVVCDIIGLSFSFKIF